MLSLCKKAPHLTRILNRKRPEVLDWSTSRALLHPTTSPMFHKVEQVMSFGDKDEDEKLFRMLELEVRGNDKAVLRSYETFTTSAAQHLGITIGNCWAPKKAHHERYTLLRSIHVNKKNMVQYELRTYFRLMQFHRLTGSTADTFLEYVERNLPEGVALKVTKAALEKIPDHLKPPTLLLN